MPVINCPVRSPEYRLECTEMDTPNEPASGRLIDLSRTADGFSSHRWGRSASYHLPGISGPNHRLTGPTFASDRIPPNGSGRVVGPTCPFCSSELTEPVDRSQLVVRCSCRSCGRRFVVPLAEAQE